MKKSGKRILSFILTAVMIFALLPVIGNPMVVKAEDTPAEHVAHDEKCSAEETDCEYHKDWTKISTWTELKSLGEDGGSGYLVDNIEISEAFRIKSGKTVNLCLNGYRITQTKDFHNTIIVDGTLNLYDKKDNSGKITHAKRRNGIGVFNYGTFTMTGGTISGNKTDWGGGVENLGTFTMKGGTISGNNATNDGGGVYNDGTFTMNGGTISGNKADGGGGVYNDGTFTMTEGTISGNKADGGGGVENKGTFTMNGGTISGNEAVNGGGVYNLETFTMTEGTIKDNTVSGNGSGVYSSESFVKEGGEIEGSIESSIGTMHTVTFNFNANDESDKTIIQYVLPNKETNLAPNKFSKEGKKFGCWRDESGNKTYEDNATIKINNNLILNALWIESAKVKFTVNNGSWSDGSTVKEVECLRYDYEDKALTLKSEDIPTPENPNTGYKAGGWDVEPDTGKTLKQDETYTYTYTFAPIEYTIKYDSNGGTGTMNNQSRTYNVNASLTANAFSFEGRTFDGWNTAADGSGTPFADGEVTGNLSETDQETITLYAQWTTDTFTISWKNYDGTVLETDKDVAYGATPMYDGETPVRAKEGNKKYTFTGWTPEVDTVKGAATYTATYSEKTVETTEPETPQNPTEPETPEEPEEEIPEKDWLDDLRLALNIAAELGGPQTVEYSGDFALSYDIMEYLKEHTDITLVYSVTYEGVTYTVTIPAGRAIADANIGWYGPLWLLANYGGNNAPTGAKGNGTYIVKAGDTLTGISVELGVTIQYLVDKNGIKNPDYIVEGQELIY